MTEGEKQQFGENIQARIDARTRLRENGFLITADDFPSLREDLPELLVNLSDYNRKLLAAEGPEDIQMAADQFLSELRALKGTTNDTQQVIPQIIKKIEEGLQQVQPVEIKEGEGAAIQPIDIKFSIKDGDSLIEIIEEGVAAEEREPAEVIQEKPIQPKKDERLPEHGWQERGPMAAEQGTSRPSLVMPKVRMPSREALVKNYQEGQAVTLSWLGKHRKPLQATLLSLTLLGISNSAAIKNVEQKTSSVEDGHDIPKATQNIGSFQIASEAPDLLFREAREKMAETAMPASVENKTYPKKAQKNDSQTGLALEAVNEYAAENNYGLDDNQGIKAAISLAKRAGWQDHIEVGQEFTFETTAIKKALKETKNISVKAVLAEARAEMVQPDSTPETAVAQAETPSSAETAGENEAVVLSVKEKKPAQVIGIYDARGHVIENVDEQVSPEKIQQEVGRLKDKLLAGAMDEEPMSAYEWIEVKRKLREIDRESSVVSFSEGWFSDNYDLKSERKIDSKVKVSKNVWQPSIEKELRTRLRRQGLDYNALNAWVLNTRDVQTELWLFSPTDPIKTFSLYEKWRQKMVLHNLEVAISRAEANDDMEKRDKLLIVRKALRSALGVRQKYNRELTKR